MTTIRNIKNNFGQLMEAREALLQRTGDTLTAGALVLNDTKQKLEGFWRDIHNVRSELKTFEKALADSTPEHRAIVGDVLPRGYEQALRDYTGQYPFYGAYEPNPTEMVVCAHFVPHALKDEIIFNQLVPWWLLTKLSTPIEAKNGGLIFSCPSERSVLNRRASAHAATAEVYAPAYWVPHPHQHLEWHSFAVQAEDCWPNLREPYPETEITLANFRDYIVKVLEPKERFTVDVLPREGGRGPKFYCTFESDTEAVFAKLSLG